MRSFILRSIAEQSAEEKKRSESSKRQRRKEKTVALPACIVFRAPVIGEVRCLFGGIAQLGERLPCKQEAIGSNPFISTIRAHSSVG